MEPRLFPGCCPLGHGEGVPRDRTSIGAELPFCEPHMDLLSRGTVEQLEELADASIFDVEEHERVRALVELATGRIRAHRGKVRGICHRCGCIDAAGCEGGCSWVDKAHTLCSACVAEAGS
jgi:hypothetical protein